MEPAPAASPAADQTPLSAQPEPQPEQAPPEALPKTGSRYPLLGISGAALLAIGGLLRIRRLA
jgi:LPXTG-motif cell wall-anchored protein